jgi:hypothetical protein
MKVLFHIPTQTLTPYPRLDEEPVVGLDAAYDTFDVLQEPQPTFNPATHYISSTETIDVPAKTVTRGWQIHDIPAPEYKIWPSAQYFMGEFTLQERSYIALSTNPTIATLRLELSTWLSEIHANNPRVVAGLDKLYELGILSPARRAEILNS